MQNASDIAHFRLFGDARIDINSDDDAYWQEHENEDYEWNRAVPGVDYEVKSMSGHLSDSGVGPDYAFYGWDTYNLEASSYRYLCALGLCTKWPREKQHAECQFESP